MSRVERWATSAVALAVVVFVVHQLNVVDETGNDPSLAPFTAVSIVHERNLDLDEFPDRVFLERPIVITGRDVTGVRDGDVFTDLDALDAARGAAGPDARLYDYFPVVPALLAVPAVLVVDGVSAVAGTPDSRELLLEDRFAPYHVASAALVVTLAVLAARALALAVLTGSERRRRWTATGAAVVLAFGTTAWSVASRALWQHGPSLLFAMVALLLVVRLDPVRTTTEQPRSVRGDAALLGMVLALAVVSRPTNAVLAVALTAWLYVRRRDLVLRAVLGATGIAALTVVVLAVLGSPVPPPYYGGGRVELHDGFLEALAANWVSPSRGLLLTTPVVLLAVPGAIHWWRDRDRRPLVVALVVTVAGVWLSVSAFPQWWAGHTFGPRFMTEALAPLFLLALPAVDRWVPGGDSAPAWVTTAERARVLLVVVVLLSVWSVGVHALGATTRQTSCWNTTPVDVDDDPGRVWSVTDAQAVRSVRILVGGDLRRAVLGPC